MKIVRLLPVALSVLFLQQGFTAVPPAVIEGPIMAEQPPSRNAIYSASALDLSVHGYIEEEFLIE